MEDRFFKFSNLAKFPEVIHGISTRSYGDMRFGNLKTSEVIKNREQFLQDLKIDMSDLIYPKLSHSSKIATVGIHDRGKGAAGLETAVKDTDGLVTNEKGVFLMVTGADCLPILFYDPINQTVMILHAGWRGIIDQIISKGVQKMTNMGSDSQNLIVGVGPGICQRHFVVRDDVLDKFRDFYPSATFVRNHDGYVDLKKAVQVDLINSNVSIKNIEITTECTSCNSGIYGSYRKEGEGAPASAAIIGMRE